MLRLEGYHPLRSLCTGWVGKIDKARENRKPWLEISDECMAFFSAATGFMWDPKYKNKFFGGSTGNPNPKFRLTVAKAFEVVALFGPTLYWKNPQRTAVPRKFIEIPPELLARMLGIDPEQAQQLQQQAQQFQQQQQQGPPQPGQPPQQMPYQLQMQLMQLQQAQQQMQQMQRQRGVEEQERGFRAELMADYLNWTPNELGLHRHSELAITEGLVKGRGVMWTERYIPPGSNRMMVGTFRDRPENLYIDPDAEMTDGTINSAWWIAKECCEPAWKLERSRRLPKGILEKAGSFESATSQGERQGDRDGQTRRNQGQTNDMVRYWKIWSKMGVGGRFTDTVGPLKDAMDRICGDYCYLEVVRGLPFPLNFPTDKLMEATDADVKQAFQWPIPYWRDARWPCSLLDFYPHPDRPWPIAPLAPGLGELKAINHLMAHLCNRIWMSSRTLIAVLESASDKVKQILAKGEDLAILPMEEVSANINELIQFLQHPEVNKDVWTILSSLMDMFERRTGLTELMYGLGPRGAGIRSATDASNRQSMVAIRPDHMASKVEEWQTEIAQREALAIKHEIEGRDVRDLMGELGAQLWDKFIAEADFEKIIHDVEFRVEANSARKPNKDRDVENINQALPIFLSFLQEYAQQHGNYEPYNWLVKKWGKAIEEDVEGMLIPPPQPPPPDPQVQIEQQKLQLEGQKLQVETKKIEQEAQAEAQQGQMDMQKAQMDMQAAAHKGQLEQQKAQMEIEKARMELEMEQARFEAEQVQTKQSHQLELFQDQETHEQEMKQARQEAALKAETAKQQAALKATAARQQAKQSFTTGAKSP